MSKKHLQTSAPAERKDPAPQTAQAVPGLYNPVLSVVFSILFTPMFGAFLHAMNWRELGCADEAERSMAWVRWTFYTFFAYTLSEPFIRETAAGKYLMIILFAVFWISWTLAMGLKHVRFVRTNVAKYTTRRMAKAVMIGALGWLVYTAFAITLILLLHVTGIDPLPATAPILQ